MTGFITVPTRRGTPRIAVAPPISINDRDGKANALTRSRGVGQSSVAFRGTARRPRRVSSTGSMLVRLRTPHTNRFSLKVPRIFWTARFTPVITPKNPTACIILENLMRRHLSVGQRSMIAEKMKKQPICRRIVQTASVGIPILIRARKPRRC
jgi:hypothetical protein